MPSFHRSTSAHRDTRRLRFVASAFLVATAVCLQADGVAASAGGGLDPPRAELAAPMAHIRAAVLAGDARRLHRCFEARQPIFVRMPPLERGGFLGPGPLDAFLRRLLADRASVSFEVAALPDVSPGSSRAFVTAVWTYRTSASSTLQVDHVHLVLSRTPEPAHWLIVELKAASR